MTPLSYIKQRQVFTLDEIASLTSSRQIASNFLSDAKRRGKVFRVRSGLYVSNAGRFEGVAASPLAVASKSAPDCVFCHASAFSLLAGFQDVPRGVFFYTSRAIKAFDFQGRRFTPIGFPDRPLATRSFPVQGPFSEAISVTATSKEQTVADALDRPRYCGGAEVVMKTLTALRFADVGSLASIAEGVGPSCCAKVGWVLEHLDGKWGEAGAAVDLLHARINGGPYYLSHRTGARFYDSRWNLYLPDEPDIVEGWLHE